MHFDPLSLGFLILAATVALISGWLLFRHTERKAKGLAVVAWLGWLVYVTALGLSGVMAIKSPPGALFVGLPALLIVLFGIVRNPKSEEFALRVSLPILMGLQFYRVFVELGFHELAAKGMIPAIMTFRGLNLDIFIGLSAPVIAALAAQKPEMRNVLRLWNILGLVSVINAIALGVGSFMGLTYLITGDPIRNVAIGSFPFTFIAGLLAPLAIVLHALSLKALNSKELSSR